MARFPGCEDISNVEERNICAQKKMFEFVYSNISYPKEDKENNIEGTGVVQFVIGADGRISDIDVLRSPSDGIKKELERLMNAMAALPEAWVPAKKDGNAVAFQLILPVKFKLQDDAKQKAIPPDIRSENDIAQTINVVPNPSQDAIVVSSFEGASVINIFDSNGNLVLSQKINSGSTGEQRVQIATLKSGQYVVQVVSDTRTMSSSFVKI